MKKNPRSGKERQRTAIQKPLLLELGLPLEEGDLAGRTAHHRGMGLGGLSALLVEL